MTIHDKLTSRLGHDEDIFIYDEPHKIAVTRAFTGFRFLYVAWFYMLSRWVVIDIQTTNEKGGQFMYNCLLKASVPKGANNGSV